MSDERTIKPNAPADFTPQLGDYKTLQPFRYWCQKVLPLVYDDSLSYYELLGKVVDYLNKTMEDVEALHGNVTNLHTAYEQLQNYVNTYFSTLDVQKEIDNKLDELVKNGTLQNIFNVFINSYYGFISVLDLGADNTGNNDCSNAFNKAIEKANATNGVIGIPTGKYLISNDLIDINTSVSIIGILDGQNAESSNTSIIIDNRHSNTPLFNFNGGANANTIKNITFWCRENEDNTNNICIKGNKVGWDMRIEKCTFCFFDCALYLDGNDLQASYIKIAFCGKNNYAFHLGTNSSMISKLHIEHCRLMLETPNLYTYANHITDSKFEMSTFKINSNKPYILLNGYNKYGLINFTDCNFYCLDYLAFMEYGVAYSNIPYMIDTGATPSILLTTKYKSVGFYNCNFNIGSGSGAYTFTPISNNCKYLKCTKPVDMHGCTFHNMSGDLDSIILYNSYGNITNNIFYFDFTDFRTSNYSQYCKENKTLVTIYNATFKSNIIYYTTEIFNITNFECDYPNKYTDTSKYNSILPIKTTNLSTTNIIGDWVLLYEIKAFTNCGICCEISVADNFNQNFVKYMISCTGSDSNINTETWKLTPLFKSSDTQKMCITAENKLLKIYYYIATKYANRIELITNENIATRGVTKKYTRLTFEEPNKNIAYLQA